uniref:Glutaredoxin domain-containing protein n=1 Tax=Panagrellus redivivus TaxID=6233 RepID=A0A7E4V721_PANRE
MQAVYLFLLATAIAFNEFIEARPEPRSVDKLVDDLVRNNNVMVFSKSYCPFSKRAKKLLTESYAVEKMEVLELDEQEDMDEIQDYLKSKTGVRTVPQVFMYGKFVGGAMDLEELDRKGKLEAVLRKTRSTNNKRV